MMRAFLKFSAAASTATALLASAPLLAAPVSVRDFAAEQLHVATIGYRLNTASVNSCARPRMLSGLLLHDLTQYDPVVRASVSSAFSLGSGVGIIQIVPDSAADRAGLHIDDEIVAVRGKSVEDPAAVARPHKSYGRIERFTAALESALQQGPAELLIRRGGSLLSITLQGERGCGGELSLLRSNEQNAWSDGARVAVTTGMMQLARSDDELAFVVAHEMAHNILGHSQSSRANIFGGRRSEMDADQMAVHLMTYAGYQAVGGVSFLEMARRRFWWSISLDHPSFARRIKIVTAAISALSTETSAQEWQVAARPGHSALATAKVALASR